ncbi:MAG: MFS transporter [Archangiaceae bacterium]|nr:MFS transporter [Archangiaceae bacterium]
MLLPILSLFTVSLGYGVVVPLLPELSGGAARITPGTVSLVYATYAAAKISAQIPGGVWADRKGGARVLSLALPLFTVSLAGFLISGGTVWFAAVRAVEGAATGLVYPAVFALVARGSEQGSGRRIGLAVGLGTSGLLLGPVLGWALAPVSLHAPVWAAIAIAAALSAWVALRPPASAPSSQPRTVKGELRELSTLGRNVAFLGLMLPIAFNKLTFSAFQGLIPLHAPTLDLTLRGVTGLFALTGIVFGAFQALGGLLADRFAPRRLVLLCSPPLLACLVALAFAEGATRFTVAYAGYIALSSVIFTATLKHAARAFGSTDTYGGVFGVLGTLTDLMTIVGPLLFLGVYGSAGAQVFLLMAGLGALSALGYVFLSNSQAPRLG